jgi:hypothetical protein
MWQMLLAVMETSSADEELLGDECKAGRGRAGRCRAESAWQEGARQKVHGRKAQDGVDRSEKSATGSAWQEGARQKAYDEKFFLHWRV